MIEIYQLEELVAFAEEGTISKAAERVGVSQPAVSRSMRLLEESVGVPLFVRTSNTIALNETGKRLASDAKAVLDSLLKAVDDARAYDRSLNTVLVGSQAPAPLWSIIPNLSTAFPDKVVGGELKSGEKILIDGLSRGSYRMIVTTRAPKVKGFSTVRLGHEALSFVLSESHPLAKRKTLSFSDLDGENMLLFSELGFWKGLPERMMPHSRFYVQSDRAAFNEFVAKSSLPSFATNLAPSAIAGKVSIPISDSEASVDYYITGRSGDLAIMSSLARAFAPESFISFSNSEAPGDIPL